MKSIKILATSIFLTLILTSIFSCRSDELSRSTAGNLIKEKFQYPMQLPFEACTTRVSVSLAPEYAHRIAFHEDYFGTLQAEGLLTYKTSNDAGNEVFTATFTDKGKPFVVGPITSQYMGVGGQLMNVKVGQRNFGEVTGIVVRKEFNVAEVSYTEKIELLIRA